MRIRKAKRADVPVLAALNRAVQEAHADAFPDRFRRDATDAEVARAFRATMDAPSSYWLVAEAQRPVAFLSAEFREREQSWCVVSQRMCYLAAIVVAPQHRKKGIARMLVAELCREASERGVSRIELDVWAFNDNAQRAFLSLGFRPMMERMSLAVARSATAATANAASRAVRTKLKRFRR